MNQLSMVAGDAEAATFVSTVRGDVGIRLTARAGSIPASQELCREHIFNIQAHDLAVDDDEVEFLVLPTWAKPLRVATLKRTSS